MRVSIYTHDPMLNLVRTIEECNELFGEDYIEDYSIDVPDQLALEMIDTYKKLIDLSHELNSYKQLQDKR